MAGADVRKVDYTGLKVGQGLTIVLLLLAFVLDSAALVAVVAVAQLLGGLDAPFAPYRVIYRSILKPSGLLRPHVITDNPEPHQFAMLVGGVMNTLAALALLGGLPALAWAVVWIVIALANLNFWINFCMGCWMYYQFNRFGVPGFSRTPIQQ
jgi:hypothetical protein